MTAASGADRACPLCAGVDPRHISPIIQAHHAAHANVREDRRRQAGADHAAFERARADLADQPTLRDQLAVLDELAFVLHRHCGPEVCVCVDDARELLPVVERAKAEAAAEALRAAGENAVLVQYDNGYPIKAVPLAALLDLAALRSNAGGDGG